MRRRKFFIAGIGATIPLISGCLGDDSDEPSTGDDSSSQDDDQTNAGDSQNGNDTDPGDDGNGSDDDGPVDSIDNYDPEDIALTYFEYWADNNQAAMDDMSHSNGTAIMNSAENVDGWYDHEIDISETELDIEELEYFGHPSAAVTVRFTLVDPDGQEFPNRYQVILVVEDEELLVFNLKPQFHEIQEGLPEGTCPPETSGDAEDLLPRTGEQFFQITRRDSFGSATASYRGPDNNRYRVEIEAHDSAGEAEGEELTMSRIEFGDGQWVSESGLLARHVNATMHIHTERENAEEQVKALFDEAGCFSDEHIVDTAW